MRFVLRLAAFAGLTAAVYAAMTAVLALGTYGGKPLFEGLTRLILRPVEAGDTAARMADFDRLADAGYPLDALFVGSSLTYRGIDARLFAQRGYRVFALGLSSQTPLNYAALLPDDAPDSLLFVFEAHPDLLATDGTEAFFAFAVNQPLGARSVEMAARVRTARALNLLSALAWYRAAHPLGSEPPIPDESDSRYVGAGFSERPRQLSADSLRRFLSTVSPTPQPMRARQLAALGSSAARVRRRGQRAAFVVPPINAAHLRRRPYLTAQLDTLRRLARRDGVPFLDLSHLPLDSLADFSDLTHLSPAGVARYNAALVDSLTRRALL